MLPRHADGNGLRAAHCCTRPSSVCHPRRTPTPLHRGPGARGARRTSASDAPVHDSAAPAMTMSS